MGMYTDITDNQTGVRVEVAHSSEKMEIVLPSKLENAWNWAGKLKDIDYSQWDDEDGAFGVSESQTVTGNTLAPSLTLAPNTAVVVSDTVRARKTLSTRSSDNVVMQLKKGQVLTDIQTGYTFDSGLPAIYGKIHGTRHPYVYVAVGDHVTGEAYLRVSTPEHSGG